MSYCVNSHTKRDIDHANLNKRVSVLTLLKQSIVCPSLFNELNMHIKRVFGHTKRVVLACCERAITFVPEIMWRVTFVANVVIRSALLNDSPLDDKRFVVVFECPNVFRQFSFVSLALVSKGCCVISVALFKICGKANV